MGRGAAAASRQGGGAASPFAKLAENAAGRANSRPTGSPRQAPEARDPHHAFLLPRHLEETHHRRLRTLLHDFVGEATAWEEAHTLDGIRWASEMAQLWDDLHAVSTPDEILSEEQRRARTVPLLLQWEEVHAHLLRVLTRLVRAITDHRSSMLGAWRPLWTLHAHSCTTRRRGASARRRCRRPCGVLGRWTDSVRLMANARTRHDPLITPIRPIHRACTFSRG